jgi:hypothetical protein
VAITPSAPLLEKHLPNASAVFAAPGFVVGIPGELPTPPPRLA